MKPRTEIKIALAGNPNSGKTSIFNGLTGAHQKVANFPGVTVEKRIGHKNYKDYGITIVDLPGTYSLTAYSLDEKVARDFICQEDPDLVVNVIDSGNLERSLYLTMQLIEMGIDFVIDLNMWDEAVEAGIEIDVDRLSQLLGAPVVKTIGNRAQGIESLLETIIALYEGRKDEHRHPMVSYGSQLDDIVSDLTREVHHCKGCRHCANPRWVAIKLLEDDRDIKRRFLSNREVSAELTKKLNDSLDHLKATTTEDPEIVITEGRYGYVAGIVRKVMSHPKSDRMKMSTSVDNVLTHRIIGYPVFLIIMWLIFQATFSLGQYPMEWIDAGVSILQQWASATISSGMFADMVIDGIIGGIGSVIIFLPNIVILFLGIALLEDSGYMARAAFLMDRLMRYIGLHGKSFIPMLMGFGCSVPAIMATRTLESPRDRILTILLLPLMSCSARLPVYILFAGAFFGAHAGNVIFSIYILGVVVAIIMAQLLRRTILRADDIPFVMELPPYRMPTAKSVVIHMWDRTKIYLQKMGGVILVASIILWALGYFPQKKEFSQDYDAQIAALAVQDTEPAADSIAVLEQARIAEVMEYTVIGRLGQAIKPVVEPLGFNWQMGVALISGFIAKEVVVSSMGVLYQLGEEAEDNFGQLSKVLRDPERGVSPLVAYAFMVFVLLYTPCIVSVLAIKREIGSRWMWFSVVFQMALAWCLTFIVYQGGLLIGLK
ncbi:MAG: ferrous iron transport protein B [candidate division Zixibacteria bacterium]|nr:ferrous iron transport protein B [candidate division Zixibacteria bacterium]